LIDINLKSTLIINLKSLLNSSQRSHQEKFVECLEEQIDTFNIED